MEKIFAALGGTSKVIDIVVKIVIAIALFFLLKSLYTKWKRRNAGKAVVNTANLDPNKNYDNIAKQVHDEFDIFFTSSGGMSGVCKQLGLMNDDEIKHVNNRYLILYGKGSKSLQDAIDGGYWGAPPDDSDCGLLLGRLQALNVN